MDDFIEGFCWHSSLGVDSFASSSRDGHERFVTRMANTEMNRKAFVTAGDKLLIHRTTKCLWRVSDDGKSILPVFPSDVLSEEEAKSVTED